MSCHVMWCCVMSFDVMWFLVLCFVTWCNVMSCDAFSCDERHLLWSDAVQWDAISWVCGEMWLVAMSRCVVRSGCVAWWSGRWAGDPYYKVLQVLQSSTPYSKILRSTTTQYSKDLQSTTQYYSSTTLYYTVLLQYYKVLLCTTQYYSVHKVLLQYYSVLQSTTPVLLRTTKYYSCTTKYYSSTTLLLCTAKYYSGTTKYYKVLLQYYSVLPSTTICIARSNRCLPPTSPSILRARKNDSHHWSMTYETSFTMRKATGVIHQRHQVLCLPGKMTRIIDPHDIPKIITMRRATGLTLQPHLPQKMTLMIDPRHRWNIIDNARSNRHHPPTSPNTAPATQNCTTKSKRNLPKTVEASFRVRGRFDHDPNMIRMKLQNWTRPFAELTFPPSATHFVLKITTFRAPAIYPNLTEYCACHEKWFSWLIIVTQETTFTMRGATGVIHCNVTKYFACQEKWLASLIHDISNVVFNAQSNRTHPPTSPNTASAT